MNKKASIYTYSIIYTASEDFKDKTPFVVAVVEDDNSRFLTRIENYKEGYDDEIKIGMTVEFDRMDENGKPLYKFVD